MIDAPVSENPRGLAAGPNQLRALVALTYYPFIAMLRNIATFAFLFLFPVAFISIFGLIGSTPGAVRLGFVSAAGGQAIYHALGAIPSVQVIQGDRAELDRQLRLGKLEAVIDAAGSAVVVEVNARSPQGQVARLVVQTTIDRLNIESSGVGQAPYSVRTSEVAGRSDRYIDFALPGQIGFALLSTAVFGTVFGLLYLKQALILKRLFATPVHGITILIGQGLARLIVALLQTVVILALGVWVFGFQLAHGWSTFAAIVLLSTLGLVVFLGFGMLIAGRSGSDNAASSLVNLFTLPQFLLSGVFFSSDVFPGWLRLFADNLPLSYFNTAMRQLATEGVSAIEIAPAVVGLCLWGLAGYALATRTFKWA